MADAFKLIRNAVGKGMKQAGLTKPATLTKYAAGERAPGNLAAGRALTPTNYAAAGLVATDEYKTVNGTIVEENDRVVVLFGALIASGAVPVANDKITIEGVTEPVISVETNSARAAYICLCRK